MRSWRLTLGCLVLLAACSSAAEDNLSESCSYFDRAVEAFQAGDVERYAHNIRRTGLGPAFEDAKSPRERQSVVALARALAQFAPQGGSGPPNMAQADQVQRLRQAYR